MKMRSKRRSWAARRDMATATLTESTSASGKDTAQCSRLDFSAARALRSWSTNTAQAAPRLSASSPRAPVPAKRSRTRLSGTRGPRMLKRASRTRSAVGRTPKDFGQLRVLPRKRPAMMRMKSVWLAHPKPVPHRLVGRWHGVSEYALTGPAIALARAEFLRSAPHWWPPLYECCRPQST